MRGGVRFSGAARHARPAKREPPCARAVSRTDRRVQGFRRAFPDGLLRPDCGTAPADRPRRHLRRHRRRGRLRGRGPLCGSRSHPFSGGPRLTLSGASADLLGRQRPGDRGRRRFRRLPAPRQSRIRRCVAARGAPPDVGQFDQHRPAPAATRLCRAGCASSLQRRRAKKPGFVVPSGNLGHGFAVLLARAMGLPVGPGRPRDQRQPDVEGLARHGPLRAAPFGARRWPMPWTSGTRAISSGCQRFRQSARTCGWSWSTDEQIEARIRSEYAPSGYVWCPHSATAVEAWCAPIRRGTFGAAVDRRRDGPSLQVRRNRRAADRPQDRTHARARRDPRPAAAQDQDRERTSHALGEALHRRAIAA